MEKDLATGALARVLREAHLLCERSIMDHLEKWTTNESLLQSYRQIFTGSQAFFLALGAILISNEPDWLFYSVAGIGLALIWFVWFRVVRVRHLVVDYHKYIHKYVTKNKSEPKDICPEEHYIKCPIIRKETNEILNLKTNWRLTRIKMDIVLPVAYSTTWLILAFYKYFT